MNRGRVLFKGFPLTLGCPFEGETVYAVRETDCHSLGWPLLTVAMVWVVAVWRKRKCDRVPGEAQERAESVGMLGWDGLQRPTESIVSQMAHLREGTKLRY